MKKIVSVLLFLFLCCTFAFGAAAESSAESTDLSVQFELPADADRSVTIIYDGQTVAVGGKLKLTAEIKALTDSAPEKSTLVWASEDKSIAKVDNKGNISGVKPGTAVITCSLKDRPDIKAGVIVTVIRAVKGIKLSEKKLILEKDKTEEIKVTFSPKDATNQHVIWTTSDDAVAVVSPEGLITAVSNGDCVITCTTEDGEKTAALDVHVPTFSVGSQFITVIDKTGITIPVTEVTECELLMRQDGKAFKAEWLEEEKAVRIIPLRHGKGSVTISDKLGPKDKTRITIVITHYAIYDKSSYPKLSYVSAARYPSEWKNSKCNFTGKILRVTEGDETTDYMISSNGKEDIVHVTINNSDIVMPLTIGKTVTVFGYYDGNDTLPEDLGTPLLIPIVHAERIVLK